MIRNCKSNCVHDVGKVIKNLGVNLAEVYRTRKVPAQSCEVVYNQLSDLSQVGFRVSDDFDLLMIARGFDSLNGLTNNAGTGSSQVDGSKDVATT